MNGVQVFDGEDYVETRGPGHLLTRFSSAPPTVGMPHGAAGA